MLVISKPDVMAQQLKIMDGLAGGVPSDLAGSVDCSARACLRQGSPWAGPFTYTCISLCIWQSKGLGSVRGLSVRRRR